MELIGAKLVKNDHYNIRSHGLGVDPRHQYSGRQRNACNDLSSSSQSRKQHFKSSLSPSRLLLMKSVKAQVALACQMLDR
jgi:hypothetical protein